MTANEKGKKGYRKAKGSKGGNLRPESFSKLGKVWRTKKINGKNVR